MICAVTWRTIGEAPRLGCQLSASVQGGYRLSRRGILTVERLAYPRPRAILDRAICISHRISHFASEPTAEAQGKQKQGPVA